VSDGNRILVEPGPVSTEPSGARPDATPKPDRRWLILGVIALAQLMIVLDATIMNIALPSAQGDLGFSIVDRQWAVTAYALPFGSLLLLGGRLADLFGRRFMFMTGLIGFAVASAVGGAAAGPSASSAPSPAPAARSGCCWAAFSPNTSTGAGACTST